MSPTQLESGLRIIIVALTDDASLGIALGVINGYVWGIPLLVLSPVAVAETRKYFKLTEQNRSGA